MAAVEIGQLPLTTVVINTTYIPVENANVTQKVEATSLKNYMTTLPTLAVSGNASAANFTVSSDIETSFLRATGNVEGSILVSTVAGGTPPLNVLSTTQVPNLYASRAALADVTTNGLTTSTNFGNIASTDVIITGNNSSLSATLRSINVNVGTFGNTVLVPQLTVDAKGRITAVSNVAITFPSQTLISNTSEITANTVSGTPGLNLTATGVTAGTYGGAVNIPQITVDSKGRVTNLSSIPVNSTLNTLNIGIPIGTIALWSGALSTIPDGWQICDGTNGTIDLRNRFVVGAGSLYNTGVTGGSANSIVPSHTHTATSTSTFSGAALPTHSHGISDPGHAHGVRVGVAAKNTSTASTGGDNWVDGLTDTAVTGISVSAQTAGTPSGTVVTSTSIGTTGSSTIDANLPPYYALYYIQKMTDAVSINNPINYMATVGNIIAGGNIVATSGNISANTRTGSMVVIGGMGVTGNINVGSGSGNAIVANGNVVVNGSLLVASGAGLVPPGGIIAWSGSEVNIPVGWLLCNGSNGTPDLRNRFIIGAGTGSSYAINATGGSKDAVVVDHTHTATVTDPGHVHYPPATWRFISDPFNGDGTVDSSRVIGPDEKNTGNVATTSSRTAISVGISSTGISGTDANLPPYYALCYIMKA